MTKNQMFGRSLAHAVGAMAYISFISWFLSNMEKLFGQGGKPDDIWAPIAMLSLLTLSAATMGVLVFARPIMLYLDNQKKEAINFLLHTLGWLFLGVVGVFLYLFLR